MTELIIRERSQNKNKQTNEQNKQTKKRRNKKGKERNETQSRVEWDFNVICDYMINIKEQSG